MKEKILNKFEEEKALYDRFGIKCKSILTELILDKKISIHYINHRVKDRASLAKKIDSKKDKYSVLGDITDICGIRIITYLETLLSH